MYIGTPRVGRDYTRRAGATAKRKRSGHVGPFRSVATRKAKTYLFPFLRALIMKLCLPFRWVHVYLHIHEAQTV